MRWLAALLILTVACSREKRDTGREVIAADYPRVYGSTLTQPLSVLVSCKIRQVPYEWRRPPDAQRTVFPSPKNPVLAAKIQKGVVHRGTHQAYVALIQGAADLLLVDREPSQNERDAARAAGVEFDVTPIALEALVVLLNTKNPVDNLTLDQLRDIYGSAATKSWAAVGGRDEQIAPFQREPESDIQEVMEKLVMKETPIRDVQQIPRIYTMPRVIATIEARETGIAYSSYYYVTNMTPTDRVKMIGIEGVKPTRGTIGTRDYPLRSDVFAVLRKGAPGESPAALLRAWLLTPDGQAVVQESGYIPIRQP